jgi:hypothetical protein
VNIDIDALRARVRARHDMPTHDRTREADADIEALLAALEEARSAIKRLTEADDDLRESVEIWIRLYDANLRRANRAEAELKRLRRDLPDDVQHLYDVLDRVDALREAVNATVCECETCARQTDRSNGLDRTSSACARCLRALDVLQSVAGVLGSKP